MPFNIIVRVEPGKRDGVLIRDADGKPLEYPDGESAAFAARDYSELLGEKVQPRRVENTASPDAWRDREESRFDSGEYQPLPWHKESWWINRTINGRGNPVFDLYAHLSTDKDARVAYTPNADYGESDRQIRVTPGRFLTRFFGADFSPQTIADIVARFFPGEDIELKFAETPDEIERVYLNGPDSCMAHSLAHYDSSVHPVRVYGAGDVRIAYLEREKNRITARCVTYRNQYGRIYGDYERLSQLLESAGYSKGGSGCLNGARVLRIEDSPGVFVVPYLDNGGGFEIDGDDHLIICDDGGISAGQTNGLSEEGERCVCDNCGDRIHPDNAYYLEDGDECFCAICYNEQTYHCDYYDRRFVGDDYYTMANGDTWSPDAFDNHGGQCEATERYYPSDELVTIQPDGVQWCLDYVDDHAGEDYESGDYYRLDALRWDDAESVYYLKDSDHWLESDDDSADALPSPSGDCDCPHWYTIELDADAFSPSGPLHDWIARRLMVWDIESGQSFDASIVTGDSENAAAELLRRWDESQTQRVARAFAFGA